METHTRLGTFEDVLEGTTAELRAIAERLRALIDELDPACVEVPRPGESAASYGVGPKKMSEAYAYIMPQSSYVNLGFFYGTALPDPEGLLEGSGRTMRHVKIRSLEAAGQPAIRDLLRAALQERREALGPRD